jgi:hypothetical protein
MGLVAVDANAPPVKAIPSINPANRAVYLAVWRIAKFSLSRRVRRLRLLIPVFPAVKSSNTRPWRRFFDADGGSSSKAEADKSMPAIGHLSTNPDRRRT